MKAQDLKKSILQLAIQGKLVEQDREDIRPDFNGIKNKATDELSFDIPDSWKIIHLEAGTDIIPSKKYQILESEVKKNGKYFVISQSKEYSIGFCDDEKKLYKHETPVIVFGDHTSEIKYVDFNFVVGADGVKIFKPNIRIFHPKFLYYQFLFYARNINKIGGYSRHYKFIKNIPFVVPPLAEQKRIVAKIEELEPLIAEYDTAETALTALNAAFPEQMKKSILQQAIQGKLVEQDPNDEPASTLLEKIKAEKATLIKASKIKKDKPLPLITEDEIPFDIPDSWTWVRLKDICQINPKNSFDDNKEASFIPMALIKEGFVSECSFETKTWRNIKKGFTHFADNDIGIAKITPCFQNRKSVVFRGLLNGVGAGTTELHVLRVNVAFIDPYYILWFVKNELFINDGIKHFTGTAGQQRISKDFVENTLFPLPPLAEQKRIVAKIEKLMQHCEELARIEKKEF